MTDSSTPPEPQCLTCGYILRGLSTNTCPECGRSFDPNDPTTFDSLPKLRRRKRRTGLAIALLLLLLCGYGLAPRGILRANLTLTCSACGEDILVRRWQAKPPDWIPLRYPGIHWTSRTQRISRLADPDDIPDPSVCRPHVFDVAVRFDLPIGGRVSGQCLGAQGEVVVINGEPVTPESAKKLLKVLLAPGNNGVRVARVPEIKNDS